jgi:hypothetical protein
MNIHFLSKKNDILDTKGTQTDDQLIVGLVQTAPVWLNRKETIKRVLEYAHNARENDCQRVAFSVAFVFTILAFVFTILDHIFVREKRQRFNLSGHHGRPGITQLIINRKRQGILSINE